MSFLEGMPTAAPQSDEARFQFSLPSQGQIYEKRQRGGGGVRVREQLHQTSWAAWQAGFFGWKPRRASGGPRDHRPAAPKQADLEKFCKIQGAGQAGGSQGCSKAPCFSVAKGGCSDMPSSLSWHNLHQVPRSPEQRGLLPPVLPAELICPSLKLPPFPGLPWELDSRALALAG